MLRVTLFILLCTVISFLACQTNAQSTELILRTVVIDAGHGGKDPGAVFGNILEKDIVLDVALRTGKFIKEQFPEVNVIYTRKTDVFIPLDKRAAIANKEKADLFISIHVNSFKNEAINGAETYILGTHRNEENLKVAQMENSVILLEDDYSTRYEGFDPNSAESYIMFELIQNEFLEQSRILADKLQIDFEKIATRKNRGVRQAGFLVLRNTTMPSILVELGYLSNSTDRAFMQTEKGKTELSRSIANAFASYKLRNDTRSKTIISENKTKSVDEIIQKTTNGEFHKIIPISEKYAEGYWYAVQILASAVKLEETNSLFQNNFPIYIYEENGWFKYFKSLTKNNEEFRIELEKLKIKYKGAFPVVFKNGKKEKYQIL